MTGTSNRNIGKQHDKKGKTQTYPKDKEQKQKDTIQKLRAERRKLLKKIAFLEDELINVQKHRPRKEPKPEMTRDEWRKEFARKFKESLKNKEEPSGTV
jgi:hypothetical protein